MKRPDYRVQMGSSEVVVEVKQIEPTPEERLLLASPPEEWNAENVYHWGMPGERVRKKIAAAVPQLRTLSEGCLPTLLVLYDAVKFWPELLDEYAIKVAMYGIETILISPEAAPEGGASVLARWHGPRRRLTPEHNTTLSAVGILSHDEESVGLTVFHNFYAATPLPIVALAAAGIPQYRLDEAPTQGFPEWQTVA